MSDAIKLSASGLASAWRELAACGAFMACLTLYALVTLDMHFTARYFHEPTETALALLAGLALFQVSRVL